MTGWMARVAGPAAGTARRLRARWRLVLAAALAGAVVVGVGLPLGVLAATRDSRYATPAEAPEAPVALVLGAGLTPSGGLSPFLTERVATAVDLYRQGKVQALLMSGDHSRTDHDEVDAMAAAAEAAGVPAEAIVTDHAGFDTYSSCDRARSVWGLHRVIVVSQGFHLPRAVWLCRQLGVEATGVAAGDAGATGPARYGFVREVPAIDKAAFDLIRHRRAHFPGPPEHDFDQLNAASG